VSTGTTGAVSEAVSHVEAELAAFWAATASEDGRTKARAATMNFIVACTLAEVEGLRAAIEDLAQTRAGRVFLVTVDGRLAPWDVETSVSAVCHKQGEAVICYDRIELHFGAMAAARAPSVLSALSLSEVPTIVEVQRGAPAPLADGLARSADRVIVDSAHTPVRRIADLAATTRAPVADRAFVRTFSWRELIARFFDEAKGSERAIGRVEIERTQSGTRDPAALLLGWLASRLHWRFESATRAVDVEGFPIDLAVHPPSPALDPHGLLPAGEIAAVRIVTALAHRPLFCACERRATERVVRWAVSGPRSSVHEHALGFRDEGWVLAKAIDSVEGDRVYREAVTAAADWAGFAEVPR
jgi:glucose-6-phosphate dehydrogenase assembly protein OpcA